MHNGDACRDAPAWLPPPPARVLLVGPDALAGRLAALGHAVTALVSGAEDRPPGPEYLTCGLFDMQPPERYAALLIQDCLVSFPDLGALFARAAALLDPEHGRLVLCDAVSYVAHAGGASAPHPAREIERQFAAQGFYVAQHRRLARDGAAGHELWDLRPGRLSLRDYQEGDESAILAAFREVFQASRSPAHWHWKFRASPFGGPCVSSVWDGPRLVAHYTGYPLPLWQDGAESRVQHIGDTLTRPEYRGVGRGATSLLGRAFRHFERLYFEGRITFAYGFNTGKIQRFGRMFLGYSADTPVHEWFLRGEAFQARRDSRLWPARLRGYTLRATDTVGEWADRVFAEARQAYGCLIARDREYLHWRYAAHPDFRYRFFVVYRWGRPLGWWLGRVENGELLLGDALFTPEHAPVAARLGLAGALQAWRRQGVDVRLARAWFSATPDWWNDVLQDLGFVKQRQFQNLDLCVKSFAPGLSAEEIGKRFYFTFGDSDLY